MSTLFVNNLNTASGTTITVPSGKSLIAPGMVLQSQYVTNTDNGVSNIAGQQSLTINNTITRGTLSTTFARKDANSFFSNRVWLHFI